jgi:hypothetical protein
LSESAIYERSRRKYKCNNCKKIKGKSQQRETRQGEGGTKEFTAREVEGKFVAET